jgi:hypothetical protein
MGSARSAAKTESAQENGSKGGRPGRYSLEVRQLAAQAIREAAAAQHKQLELAGELLGMAQALEEARYRAGAIFAWRKQP